MHRVIHTYKSLHHFANIGERQKRSQLTKAWVMSLLHEHNERSSENCCLRTTAKQQPCLCCHLSAPVPAKNWPFLRIVTCNLLLNWATCCCGFVANNKLLISATNRRQQVASVDESLCLTCRRLWSCITLALHSIATLVLAF